MADELDDQLDYHFDSEPEVIESTQSPDTDKKPGSLKRAAADSSEAAAGSIDAKKRKAEKQKARLRARMKEKKRMRNEQDRIQKLEIAKQEPALIADFILGILRRADENLSALELSDRSVPESSIMSTSGQVMDRSLENYPEYFTTLGLDRPKGDELVVVLCLSWERVGDVGHRLSKLDENGALILRDSNPKLVRCLKQGRNHIAVSTPGRLQKFIDKELLSPKQIKKVVIDSSIVDIKQRSLWEYSQTIPLVSGLAQNSDTKVYLF